LSEEIGDAMKKEILMILQELNRINKEEVINLRFTRIRLLRRSE
jgi:hypothetical protein